MTVFFGLHETVFSQQIVANSAFQSETSKTFYLNSLFRIYRTFHNERLPNLNL